MRSLRGHLSAVEDEWHIAGIPYWLDPVFTFQRTWYPHDIQNWSRPSFNTGVAKAFSIIGAGLAGYLVWDKTHRKVYTGLAGASGFFLAPLLVAAYDNFYISENTTALEPTIDVQQPGTEITPTLVTGSPQILAPSIKTSSAARAAMVNTVTENLI